MTVLEALEQLHRDDPASALPGRGRPCTLLIAELVQTMLAHRVNELDLREGMQWWQDVNVWDPAEPWSLPDAMARLARVAPGLTALHGVETRLREPQAWYVVQGWRRLPRTNGPDDAGDGHAFLAAWTERDDRRHLQGYVLQSSVERGLRLDTSPRDLSVYLSQYRAGVRVAPLWLGAHDTFTPGAEWLKGYLDAPVSKEAVVAENKRKIKIPWAEIKELAGALLAAGTDRDDIPRIVGEGLDELIDFDALLNGPVGEPIGDALEAIDGPAFTAATALVLRLIPAPALIAFAGARQAARLAA